MAEIIFEDQSYKIIGARMEERPYTIRYKGKTLPGKYFADFVVFDSVISEVKATPVIINPFVCQTLNYLKASGIKLGIIVNFGNKSLSYKRVIF